MNFWALNLPNRRSLIYRVGLGLKRDEAQELGVCMSLVVKGETMRMSLCGSVWLYYTWLTTCWWMFNAHCYYLGALAADAASRRAYASRFAGMLTQGLQPQNIWKVCRRGAGIEHWTDRRRRVEVRLTGPRSEIPWIAVAGLALLLLCLVFDLATAQPTTVLPAAFFNFYLIPGTGADINAGNTTGAAQVTTTNGNWNSTTGVFIAASGTPFASTVVGDYASVYVDGATIAVFVGKVTTVTSNVNITVDVTTLFYGTKPSTSATGRSCTINGAWASEQVLAAGGLASTTVPQSTKINFTSDLTLTAARVISMAGAATTPLWFSGYNTTPGDLDGDTTNALSKPTWTLNATFVLTTSGASQLWSSLSLSGNRTNTIWNCTGVAWQGTRCRSENTSSNAAAIALTPASNQSHTFSWWKTPTTATTTGTVNNSSTAPYYIGNVVEGGGVAGINGTTGNHSAIMSVFLNNTGAGILATSGSPRINHCTFYTPSVDGVKWTAANTAGAYVVGCLFVNGTNGINNASGGNVASVFRACNDYYNVTNPEVGFGDHPAFFGQTESADPTTSATDMTPTPNSNARNNGFPGIYENQSYKSFPDIGAVQAAPVTAVQVTNTAIFPARQSVGY